MSSTLFPVKSKSGNEEEIKKLEGEIEALRCSTQLAIQQSFQDADRIRDEIYRELEKKRSLFEQIQEISESPLGQTEGEAVREIMDLISSHGSVGRRSQDSQVKTLLSSFTPDNFSSVSDSIPSNKQNFDEASKRRKSFNILDIGSLAGSILQPLIDKPSFNQPFKNQKLLLSSTWHGRTNRLHVQDEGEVEKTEPEPISKSLSSGNLDMLGSNKIHQIKEERSGLESELLNEIVSFEQLSKVAIEELDHILKEKSEMVEEIERKVRSQQTQIKHVQEAIERTKICLADSSLHVDFPNNEEKLEIGLGEDDKGQSLFSKSGLTKINQTTKKGLPKNSSFQSLTQLLQEGSIVE